MTGILVVIECKGSSLSRQARGAISAAQKLARVWKKEPLYAVCVGELSATASGELSGHGFQQIFRSKAPIAESVCATAGLIEAAYIQSGSDVAVAANSTLIKEIFPYLAGRRRAGMASDVVAITDEGGLIRNLFAGRVAAEVVIETSERFVSVRGSRFDSAAAGNAISPIEEISSLPLAYCELISRELRQECRLALSDATVVVGYGRGAKSEQAVRDVILPLADILGASVGATRGAIDAGYAPNDWQIGQTGKVIAPTLYFAVGISGAVQHLAGIQDAGTIVAVNSDPTAAIFEAADLGLVADLFKVVPELTQELGRVKNEKK